MAVTLFPPILAVNLPASNKNTTDDPEFHIKFSFSQFNLGQILIIIILLGLSAKGVITFFDWVKERLYKLSNKQLKSKKTNEQIKNQEETINNLKKDVEKIQKSIDTLIESDKENIKAWITEKHHYYCYEKKYIDDYTLDCLERRFSRYEEEGGNSFVHNLMDDLRDLPRKP